MIRLEPWTQRDDGRIELAATLDVGGASHRLWWRVPAAWRDALTTWADPFVIGFLFPAMAVGGEIEIAAPVSPSLLANLERFTDTWHLWEPDAYRPLRFRSREEAEPPMPTEPATRIMPFSGGVDSCFTAFRHARRLAGRGSRPIGAGVLFHGFDTQPTERNAAERLAFFREGATAMLGSLGIPTIEIETNFRTLPQLWKSSHATQLASGLALFGNRFGGALIANSVAYDHLDRPVPRLGSHPLTDPFLSSDTFAIADDGGTFRRWQKAQVIGDWPEAMRHLRVCFNLGGEVGNCGRCEKCIRTAIAFRIAGHEPPAGLPRDLSPRALRHLRISVGAATASWADLEQGIVERGQQQTEWADGVSSVVRRARRRRVAKAIKQPFVPVRGLVRALFRGSSKSRKQLAAQRAATSDA